MEAEFLTGMSMPESWNANVSESWSADVWKNMSQCGSWVFWNEGVCLKVKMLMCEKMWVMVEAEFFEM